MARLFALVAALVASASAFSPTAAPAVAARRASAASPVMSESASRRAFLGALVFAVPAAASATTVPGLNGPGLVPAKKVARQPKPEFETIRDNGSLNHFWNGKGIMNSVPKVKGIITPKSTCGPVGAETCGKFSDYAANPDFKD